MAFGPHQALRHQLLIIKTELCTQTLLTVRSIIILIQVDMMNRMLLLVIILVITTMVGIGLVQILKIAYIGLTIWSLTAVLLNHTIQALLVIDFTVTLSAARRFSK